VTTATRRASLAIAAAAGLWGVAWLAARALIVRAPLDRADAIVVLAGAHSYLERTRHAAALFRVGVAPVVLLTNDRQQAGWSQREERNPFFVEAAARELERDGVPASAIRVLPEHVATTHDEAVALLREVTEQRFARLLVVTSAYHSRRALWTFRRVLSASRIEVGIDPAEPGLQTPRPGVWAFTLRGWRDVPEEYLKLIYYRVRYR
jgi:uncharacterized SAM-binding protein YcdF (DUF218 family)